MEIAILIIENSQREKARIRALLEKLSSPVNILEPGDLESGQTHVDVVILSMSRDIKKQEQLDETLARARSVSPKAQLILLAPRTLKNLDRNILKYKARSLMLKPPDERTFTSLLENVLSPIQRRKEREGYKKKSSPTSRIADIVGRSEEIQKILLLLERISESASTSVLLLGETGTGKSLFAQCIHEMSNRAAGPFIEINCAALPENLMESELFGYEPGAFTDAKNQKIGLIELADHGTLFFDEVTEIGLQTQAKLLKFLDSKRIRRLGGDEEIEVDARIIAASNRNLKKEVQQRNFREDLFYRLNVVEVRIPPLRERKTDTEMIAGHYLDKYKKKFNKRHLHFSRDALELIREYAWPGNVRELINVIERAVLLCKSESICKEDLPIQHKPGQNVISLAKGLENFAVELPSEGISLEALEKRVIEEMLKRTGGNVLKTARLLSVTRGTLRYKMMKYEIDSKRFQKRPLIHV